MTAPVIPLTTNQVFVTDPKSVLGPLQEVIMFSMPFCGENQLVIDKPSVNSEVTLH